MSDFIVEEMYRDYPNCQHNFVGLLEQHVKRCFESKTHFTTSFAIVQSSGMGKTKLCLEYLKRNIGFFVYCGRASLGIYNTSQFSYIINSQCSTTVEGKIEIIKKFFHISLIHMLDDLDKGISKEDFSKMSFPVVGRTSRETFWQNVEKVSANWPTVSLNDILVIKSRFKQHNIEYATYCFDSAKNLIHSWKYLEAFLMAIDFFREVLCVIFTDCSLSIIQEDLKSIEKLVRRTYSDGLFSPFFTTCSCECHIVKEDLPVENLFEWILARDHSPLSLLEMGRPLWITQLAAARNNKSSDFDEAREIEYIISLAATKLARNLMSTTAKLAVILARLPRAINHIQEEIGKDIVSCNMAIIHSISTNRKEVSISYMSDPVLAAGAAFVSKCYLPCSFKFLQDWESKIGKASHAMAALIMLRAFDRCASSFLRSVSATDFFKKMIDYSFNRPGKLETARIAFNHFIQLENIVAMDDLCSSIRRMSAIWCCSHQPSFNFCIPMILKSNRIGCIFVKVVESPKNFDKTEFKEMITSSRDIHGISKLDCVYIAMSLSFEGKSSVDARSVDKCRCVLAQIRDELF